MKTKTALAALVLICMALTACASRQDNYWGNLSRAVGEQIRQ